MSDHESVLRQEAGDLACGPLRLRSHAACDFVHQFSRLAVQAASARIDGDGLCFRQAFCFPVISRSGETLQIFPGMTPVILLETMSGLLLGVRVKDAAGSRFSPMLLAQQLSRALQGGGEDLPDGREFETRMRMLFRRNVSFCDVVLDQPVDEFWRLHCPELPLSLTDKLLQGFAGLPENGRRLAQVNLRQRVAEGFSATRQAFIDRLDQKCCQLAARLGEFSLQSFNRFRGLRAEANRNLMQALDVFPLLTAIFLFPAGGHQSRRLRCLIEDGQPLWPALTSHFRVREEVLRSLRGQSLSQIGDCWHNRLDALMAALALLPPEYRPKGQDDWPAFNAFASRLNVIESDLHRKWLLDLARAGWRKALQKVAALPASPDDLLNIGELLRETVRVAWARQEVGASAACFPLPELQRRIGDIFTGLGVMRLLRASMIWHEYQLHYEGEVAQGASAWQGASWPVPLQVPMRLGDLFAHFLDSTQALQEEGAVMKHCVGFYSDRCLFEGSSIVSLRLPDGQTVSTAQLKLVENGAGLKYVVAQHSGFHNASPSSLACEALMVLLEHLNSANMQRRLLELEMAWREFREMDARSANFFSHGPLSPLRLSALEKALAGIGGFGRFVD